MSDDIFDGLLDGFDKPETTTPKAKPSLAQQSFRELILAEIEQSKKMMRDVQASILSRELAEGKYDDLTTKDDYYATLKRVSELAEAQEIEGESLVESKSNSILKFLKIIDPILIVGSIVGLISIFLWSSLTVKTFQVFLMSGLFLFLRLLISNARLRKIGGFVVLFGYILLVAYGQIMAQINDISLKEWAGEYVPILLDLGIMAEPIRVFETVLTDEGVQVVATEKPEPSQPKPVRFKGDWIITTDEGKDLVWRFRDTHVEFIELNASGGVKQERRLDIIQINGDYLTLGRGSATETHLGEMRGENMFLTSNESGITYFLRPYDATEFGQ